MLSDGSGDPDGITPAMVERDVLATRARVASLEQDKLANDTSWAACQADRAELQKQVADLTRERDEMIEAAAVFEREERLTRQQVADLQGRLDGMTGERDSEREISRDWELRATDAEGRLKTAEEALALLLAPRGSGVAGGMTVTESKCWACGDSISNPSTAVASLCPTCRKVDPVAKGMSALAAIRKEKP